MSNSYLKSLKCRFKTPDMFIKRHNRPRLTGLNLIIGCAGYGKTAYAAQLMSENKNSIGISLSAEDDSYKELLSLFAYACACADKTDVCSYYDADFIITHLSENKKTVFVDNADIIEDKKAASFFKILVEMAIDSRITLVFSGRKIPSFLIDNVMRNEVNLIGVDILRFKREEICEFVSLAGIESSEKLINSIYAYTDGWCIAVAEIIRKIKDDEYDPIFENIISRGYLKEYIDYNILSYMNSDLKEYVKLTAFFDEADSAFSEEVFQISDSRQKFSALKKMGIIYGEDSDYPVYSPIMKKIFSDMISSSEKNRYIDRASGFYIRQKHFSVAIKLFEECGNVIGAENVLKNYGDRFLSNCEFELIGYCGDIIEKYGKTSDPDVLGILAQYYYYCGNYKKMESAFNMADSMFGTENKYSVYRRLYNGLIRYEANTELYSENVKKSLEYLSRNNIPLPFLYQKELDSLEKISTDKTKRTYLKISRFGNFSLRVSSNNKEIQCKSRRSVELIAYMVENQGKPIDRETMLNILWPDDMPNNAVAMLHNIIYGFRKELFEYDFENIISYKNKCYFLDMSFISDEDFQILEICDAIVSNDNDKVISYEKQLEKYWGKYLGNIDSSWADANKEYYDKCFIDASILLAEHNRKKGDYQRELIFLRNALALDPYSEQLTRDLLLCYFALGKPDKAKKKYEEYSEMIGKELGIQPSKWLKRELLSCFSVDL